MKLTMTWKGSQSKGFWIEIIKDKKVHKFNDVEDAIEFIRTCDSKHFDPCGSPC